jgi:hypothetical protein
MPALNRFRNVGACTQQNSSGYVALRDRSLVHELGRESLRRLAWRCSEHHKRVGCAILSCSRPISRAEGIKEQVKQYAQDTRPSESHRGSAPAHLIKAKAIAAMVGVKSG